MQKQRAVRIFISSTFNDMMDEREHLMKVVFPELRRRCKARLVEITEVDLRWGIPETREDQVIEICLQEIDKSRPYFVGILGGRYGWIPGNEEYEKHGNVLESFPWITGDLQQGLSITEMEIQYGVLRNRKMKGKAFFYLRDNAPQNNEDESSQQKLKRLKEEIRAQQLFPVRDYNQPEQLGSFILEDLWQQIERDFPLSGIPDPHQQEQLAFDAVAGLHLRFFHDPQNVLGQISDAFEKGNKVLVQADKGSGKSALLSAFAQQNRASGTLLYFCGATSASLTLAGMVQWIATELKRRYQLEYNIPSRVENPHDLLSAFLHAVPQQEDLLLMIDGIEQLQCDANNQRLQWVPGNLPPNVKLLLSSASALQGKILQNAQFTLVNLLPFDSQSIPVVAEKYFSHYSKQLPATLTEQISRFGLSALPVVLFSLLNELRIFGKHEALTEHLGRFTRCQTIEEFFAAYLTRLEEDFGSEEYQLRKVLCSFSLASEGLSEHEIMEIHAIAPVYWAQLYNTLEEHMLNKSGVLSLENRYLRDAIKNRYMKEELQQTHALKPLLRYFRMKFEAMVKTADHAYLSRISDELAPLAIRANDPDLLVQTLSYIPLLANYFEHRNEALANFVAYARKHTDLPGELKKGIDRMLDVQKDPSELCKGAFIAGHIVAHHDMPQKAVPFFELVLDVYGHGAELNYWITEALSELAALYSQLGESKSAGYILENLLPYCAEQQKVQTLDLLAQEYMTQGRSEMAAMLYLDTLAWYTHRYGQNHISVAVQKNNLARNYDLQKDFDAALQLYKEAADLVCKNFGPGHSLYQTIQSNIGILLMNLQRLEEAEKIFEQVLEIRRNNFGLHHRFTLKTMNSLGVCKSLAEDHKAALELFSEAENLQNQLLGPSHSDTLATRSNIADLFARTGQLHEAARILEDILNKSITHYGQLHERTLNAAIALADIYVKQGETQKATEVYTSLISLQEEYYGREHPMTRYTRSKLNSLRQKEQETNQDQVEEILQQKLKKASTQLDNHQQQAALDTFREVVDLVNLHFDGSHPAKLESLSQQAAVYHQEMEYTQAAQCCSDLLALASQVFEPAHPVILEYKTLKAYNLFKDGELQAMVQELFELSEQQQAVLDFKKEYISRMYREMLGFYHGIVECQQKLEAEQDRYDNLYEQLQLALQNASESFSHKDLQGALDHCSRARELAITLNNDYAHAHQQAFEYMAIVFDRMQQSRKALDTLHEGLKMVQKWHHPLHNKNFRLLRHAGELLSASSQQEDAAAFLDMARKVNLKDNDYPNERTLDINMSLIHFMLRQGRKDLAKSICLESLTLAQQLLPEDHTTLQWFRETSQQIENP